MDDELDLEEYEEWRRVVSGELDALRHAIEAGIDAVIRSLPPDAVAECGELLGEEIEKWRLMGGRAPGQSAVRLLERWRDSAATIAGLEARDALVARRREKLSLVAPSTPDEPEPDDVLRAPDGPAPLREEHPSQPDGPATPGDAERDP